MEKCGENSTLFRCLYRKNPNCFQAAKGGPSEGRTLDLSIERFTFLERSILWTFSYKYLAGGTGFLNVLLELHIV
jgi:hypothetical protein